MVDAVVFPDGGDWGVVVGTRVGWIWQTMGAAAQTGHNVTSPDAIWVVVLFFSSFFCILKMMLMQLEYSREGLLWFMSRPFLKN